jgi:hypothetical protein
MRVADMYYFWDDENEHSYTRFRFKHRDLYKNFSEKKIRELFNCVYLFMDGAEYSPLSWWDVWEHMERRGEDMTSIGGILYPVMGFVFRERGYTGINYDDLKMDILDLVFEITSDYIDDVYRFATILTDRLIEEYKTGDRSMPMNEVAKNLRRYPELAFLPFELLEDAASSVFSLLIDNDH